MSKAQKPQPRVIPTADANPGQQIRDVKIRCRERSSGRETILAPRAMTRAEYRAFRAAGMDPRFWRTQDLPAAGSEEEAVKNILAYADDTVATLSERTEQMIDWILEHVYAGYDFDATMNDECILLAQQTYLRTVRTGEAEIKN